jgi:hypothetical protein
VSVINLLRTGTRDPNAVSRFAQTRLVFVQNNDLLVGVVHAQGFVVDPGHTARAPSDGGEFTLHGGIPFASPLRTTVQVCLLPLGVDLVLKTNALKLGGTTGIGLKPKGTGQISGRVVFDGVWVFRQVSGLVSVDLACGSVRLRPVRKPHGDETYGFFVVVTAALESKTPPGVIFGDFPPKSLGVDEFFFGGLSHRSGQTFG